MMVNKNVLIISNVASMIYQFNMRNIDILSNLNYKICVACNFERGNTCTDNDITELKKQLHAKNVNYFQVDMSRGLPSPSSYMSCYKQIKKICKEENITIIFCFSFIGGIIGRLIGKSCGIKVIYMAHGFQFSKEAPYYKNLIFSTIETYLSKFTDTLITINIDDYEYANKNMFPKKSLYVPGVGIPLKKYNIDVNVEEIRHDVGVSSKDYLIISVGELSSRKNHLRVIKALSLLEDKSIKYIICGKGILEQEIKKLVVCKV